MFPPTQRGLWLLFRIDPLRRIQTEDRFERPEPSEQAEWLVSLEVRNRRGFPSHLRELLKSGIERDQIPSGSWLFVEGVIECDGDISAAPAFVRISAPRCFDQKLAHRARSDSLEMQAGRCRETWRL